MPQVLFDVTRLLARGLKARLPTGIDRFDLAYLERYASHARAVLQIAGSPVVLSSSASARLFDRLAAFETRRPAKLVQAVLGAASAFEPVRAGAIYLNTSHSGLARARFGEGLVRRNVRAVWMVHDLIPIAHPEYARAGEGGRHTRRMENALRHASALLANSRATLRALQEFAQARGVSLPPTRVAPLAPALPQVERPPRPLAEPYFLVVGTIEPRKNLPLLLHVWQRLVAQFGQAAPRLVIAGRRGWECENVVDLLERSGALRGHVVELPSCPDAELAGWLAHANALLFPSFVEGYGLPLVEALACGTPAIASDLAVFREIAGDAPDYLDPLDGPAWLERVRRYAAPESPERQAQLQRIAGFRAPSWGEHFAIVDALLDELAAADLANRPGLAQAPAEI